MIPHANLALQTPSWQAQLSGAVREPTALFELLGLDTGKLPAALRASRDFPLFVPHAFLAKIRRGDIDDPLLAQVLPRGEELEIVPGFGTDPVGEQDANPQPGLIHKYRGRVLLMASTACPIHCRYCFRRHFPYQDNRPARDEWQQALSYLSGDQSIKEVILSGGDPLTASDRQLAWLVTRLAAISRIKRLRVHTRFVVAIPSRITDECLQWLAGSRLTSTMVLHVNHPNELGDDTLTAVRKLKTAGVDVLNQSVLLRGVNDDAATLTTLSEKLYDTGILPYYLHMLDPVQGAAHFAVSEARAQELHAALLAALPGYLVPRLVREVPGESSKLAVSSHSPS
ncbi:MAG TPA: EF-P beta-lysylation protein EpmB [Porticoccaceae bacterium]|nr:EF-P beta-lysylation protein EpmB [Porticoccaceae bacterium]